jgi:hypothetical protein
LDGRVHTAKKLLVQLSGKKLIEKMNMKAPWGSQSVNPKRGPKVSIQSADPER